MEWKDETSYARGERGEVEPRTWGIVREDLGRITVHRHRDYPGAWMLAVYRIGIERLVLKSKTAEEAQSEALKMISDYLRRMADDVPTGVHTPERTPDDEVVARARQAAEQDAEFRKSIAEKQVRVVRAVVFEGDSAAVIAQIARSLSLGLHDRGCRIRISQGPIEILD